ncbi:MAG: DNA polymerase III subunit alpha [Treponema sp.]|jgi:DNA polymerase-3 subunit alpha|nr:DNA polymerase III subunit alpha [Treponema sp.]
MADFVHLHVHSDFSLGDAAVSVMALADKAEKLGMKYLALTDHGNMFGAMEFLAACKETLAKKDKHEKRKNPLIPIIGCEVYVAPGSRHEKKGSESDNRYYHLVLLAVNRNGYNNLVKLCSYAYTEGFYYRPRIDEELLAEYHDGLIALSACASGEISSLIQTSKLKEAEQKALYYQNLFGEDEKGNPNFYLEIQDHHIPAGVLRSGFSEEDLKKAIVEIAKKTGIPLVATNDVHYLNREDSDAHDTLICIGTGKVRTDERRIKYHGNEFYMKTGDEMAALFSDYPEAVSNTVRIAERCAWNFQKIKTNELPNYLPDFEIPPGFNNADAYLRHLAFEGLAKRYPKEKAEAGIKWEEILKRFETELDTIIPMNFTGYFLIVADFINWAKERNIPVGPGRGSGAGSIVAYSLRITDIDPLKYKLLFERFLNKERISMPDFDIDFANEGRDDVRHYVTEKYGQERVGQIITFGTLGAKAVIKDVARVLGISIDDSNKITKLIPKDPKITLAKAIKDEPKLRELTKDARYTELFSMAAKLEGLHRHSSIHAAGVVIGKTSLIDFVPLYRDSKTGGIATQYSMNYLEGCGLIKMDFLGLKTLDVIKNTVVLIRQRGGDYTKFDIDQISETDEATFKMLGEGKSFEVFQFESEGMQDVLKRAKPNSIEDLTALNSLYRPGPMDSIPQFVDSKNDKQKIRYPDPSLEDVLKETYGVITYQEQVMKVAQIIAGYTPGQADSLRKAMGKKDKEIINKEKIPFLDGAAKQGYSKEKASEIYDIIAPFAGYGFNKCHAAAYSVVAYHTAYLKANFTAEFMAANLTKEINATDKDRLSESIAEARKMGLVIDPPDINRSQKLFSVVEGRIVYGLLGIKGLGDGPADEVVNGRKEGPYKSFLDFLNRVDIKAVGKSVIERLIQTGAFDRFGIARSTLQGNLEQAIEYAQNIKNNEKFWQTSLFGERDEKEHDNFVFENFPETSRAEKLTIEKELIGFYFSGHPLDEYRSLWQKTVKSIDLGRPETLVTGSCTLLGIIKSIKTHDTKKRKSGTEGDQQNPKNGKMAFVTLEDYNGEIEMVFFPKAWTQYEEKIAVDGIALIRGKIEYQKDKDRYGFLADEVIDLEMAETLIEKEDALSKQMENYRLAWEETVKLNLANVEEADPKEDYTLIGILRNLKPFHTKNGNDMAYAVLSDYNGEIDVTIFPKPWTEMKEKLADNVVTALKGKIKNDSYKNKPVFYPDSILSIDRLKKKVEKKSVLKIPEPAPVAETVAGELHIRLQRSAADNEETLYSIKNILADNPGPTLVFIHVPFSKGETVIRTASQISAAQTARNLQQCMGIAEVWENEN